jgi:hypothetical protein
MGYQRQAGLRLSNLGAQSERAVLVLVEWAFISMVGYLARAGAIDMLGLFRRSLHTFFKRMAAHNAFSRFLLLQFLHKPAVSHEVM